MDELVTFLRARLDEDQQIAREAVQATTGRWTCREAYYASGPIVEDECGAMILPTPDGRTNVQYPHIARHDPARVLADVDAKRRRIDLCVEVIGKRDLSRYGEFGLLKDDADALAVTVVIEMLRLEALPHAGHPDYREDWRP